MHYLFFFQAEDGIRSPLVTGVQTCALPICGGAARAQATGGMRAPVLAIGDGALGFWGAVREVFPEAKEQRCWVHKIANTLDALPKSLQPKAKAALHEIMNAENKEAAGTAMDRFQETYGAKYPK